MKLTDIKFTKKLNPSSPQELRPLFVEREVEEDTSILSEKYFEVEDVPVLRELWCWDGITANSLIMPKKYLDGLQESDILALLRRHFEVAEGYTFSNRDNSPFVYINYGFVFGD